MAVTYEQAMEIRETYARLGAGGAGMGTLAARYGISSSTVNLIVKGRHYLVRDLPALPTRGNPFATKGARIGAVPIAGQPAVSDKQAKKLAGLVVGLGSRKERMKLPCPKCDAKVNDPCWSTRGSYPTKLKGLHDERKVTQS